MFKWCNHLDYLQDLMEKTIVLALATGQKHFTASFTKLLENYAELLASQGLLTTARKYLKLLAIEDSSTELALLHDRISFSVEGNGTIVDCLLHQHLPTPKLLGQAHRLCTAAPFDQTINTSECIPFLF